MAGIWTKQDLLSVCTMYKAFAVIISDLSLCFLFSWILQEKRKQFENLIDGLIPFCSIAALTWRRSFQKPKQYELLVVFIFGSSTLHFFAWKYLLPLLIHNYNYVRVVYWQCNGTRQHIVVFSKWNMHRCLIYIDVNISCGMNKLCPNIMKTLTKSNSVC